MLNTAQKATIRRLHKRTLTGQFKLDCFYQDRFYSSRGMFGYPVTLTLDDALNGQPEERKIIQWCTHVTSCERWMNAITEYIASLEAVK